MDLGQVLMQMMGGSPPVAGQPGQQFAPPMGIPWQPPVAAAPPPPQPIRPSGSTPQTQRTMTRTYPEGGEPATGRAALEPIGEIVNNWMENNRARWAAADSAERADSRFAADDNFAADQGAETSAPVTLKKPGPGSAPSTTSATPARGNAETQGYIPDLTAFDVYGAPVPTRRPLDLGQMLYDVPLPERRGAAPTASASPAAPAQGRAAPAPSPKTSPAGAQVQGTEGGARRGSTVPPFQGAPNTDDGFTPTGSPLFDPLTQKFLLQTGLSLMTPKWGGPLSNIGQAVGEGAEAVTRAEKGQREEQLTNKKIQLEEARINKMGLGRKSKESSGSKKLKEKTPIQQLVAGMSPEAGVYFTQRIKDLNKVGDDETETADAKMQRIMQETQAVDRRARASRGQAMSADLPDALIEAAAGTPQEAAALGMVAADPVQKALVQARIEAAKSKKAAKPNG